MSKIEKKGKVKIIDNEFVEKNENDIDKIHAYLLSRDFNLFIPIINREENRSRYPYIEDLSVNDYQKGEDLIKTISLLHNKTSFNKEVNLDTYKDIYDNIIGNINYLEKYFTELIQNIEYHEYPSPSELLLLENYYKINELIGFLKNETKNWYKLVNNKNKQRVCMNHGKPELSHLIKNDKCYFISMEDAHFSSPINDIIYLYKKEWDNLEFSSLLKNYLDNCKLSEDELKLLLIMISIPNKINTYDNEYKNTIEVRRFFDYIYKTENLIRPYYTKQEKE